MQQTELHYVALVYDGKGEFSGPLAKQEYQRLFLDVSLHARCTTLERRFEIERACCERLEREKRQLAKWCVAGWTVAVVGLLVGVGEVLWIVR